MILPEIASQFKVLDGEPSFETYRRYSAQPRQEAEILGSILGRDIEHHDGTFSILDIGAGDGIFAKLLVAQLKDAKIKRPVDLSWLEPERAYVQQLQAIGADLRKPFSASVIEGKWEDYQPERRFDAILLVHVHYYFPDSLLEVLFEKMVESLNPGGVLMVVARAKGYEDYEFIKAFYQRATRGHFNEKTIEDAERVLSRINRKRLGESQESLTIEKRLPRAHVVFPFQTNGSDAGKLVTFYLRTSWDGMPPDLQMDIKNWILDPRRGGKLQEVDGILIVRNPDQRAELSSERMRAPHIVFGDKIRHVLQAVKG